MSDKQEPSIKLADAALGGDVKIPTNRYQLHVKAAESTLSRKGNPMVVLTCEIISPDTVEFAGETIAVQGKEVRYYLSLSNAAAGIFKQTMTKLGLLESLDQQLTLAELAENFPLEIFNGLTFEAVLSSEENVKRQDPTPEQLAAGQTQGDPILDSNGQELRLGWIIRANLANIIPGSAGRIEEAY